MDQREATGKENVFFFFSDWNIYVGEENHSFLHQELNIVCYGLNNDFSKFSSAK